MDELRLSFIDRMTEWQRAAGQSSAVTGNGECGEKGAGTRKDRVYSNTTHATHIHSLSLFQGRGGEDAAKDKESK